MLIVMGRPLASLTTSTNSRPLNEPAATRRATRTKSVSAWVDGGHAASVYTTRETKSGLPTW